MNIARFVESARAAAAGAVLGVVLASAGAQQGVVAIDPPARGDTVPLREPTPKVPREQVLPDGSIFDVSPAVMPRFIAPDSGLGLPDGDPGIDGKPMGRPKLEGLPPVYSPGPRRIIPPTEDRSVGGGPRSQPLFQDFSGMGVNGWTPPDPDVACGYDYIVAVTNDDFTVYDRCGVSLYTVDINTYLGVGTDYSVFDPKVIFDPWNGRWVMLWHKKKYSTEESELVLVITGGSTPFGLSGAGAYWYNFNAVQNAATAEASWADYYDLGYSAGWLTLSGNQFRFSDDAFKWGRIRYVDKADVYAAAAASMISFSNLTNPDGSAMSTPRAVKMQTSWSEGGLAIDALFVNSRSGGGDKVTTRKIRDAGAANTLTAADILTAAYTAPPSAVQPDGSTLDTINCRLMTAVATNDSLGANGIELFTALTYGSGADCRIHLMKFNPVASTLEWQSQFGSTGQDYWFACIAADFSGSAVWAFSRTSSTVFAEARYVDYNQGVFSSASSLLKSGTGNYGGFRWGDYLGGGLDWGDYNANFSTPGRPAKMWIVGEWATAGSWDTHIGATSVFTQGDLSSVTPSTTYVITGPKGGPFAPASRVYTLGHTGETGVQVQITGLPTWLTENLGNTNADLYPGGGSATLSVNSAVANTLAMGTYNDSVTFADCFNGGLSYARAVQIVVQAPDIDVVTLNAANGLYHPGDIINVTGSYTNNGNIATGLYSANFYLSLNTTISTGDELIDSRNYLSLAAGGTLNFNHNLSAIPCVGEGPWYVGVIVTVTNDNSTADNSGFDATTISVAYCQADYNNDCFVDGIDYDLFMADFESADPVQQMNADYNGDGFVDGIDYDLFMNDFETGNC